MLFVSVECYKFTHILDLNQVSGDIPHNIYNNMLYNYILKYQYYWYHWYF